MHHNQKESEEQMETPVTKTVKQVPTKAPATATTKAPAPKAKSGPEALQAAREARERGAKNDVFTYSGQIAEGAKALAPQAQAIVNIIQSHKAKGIRREDLVKEMEGVVTTKQPLTRILSYYQSALITSGYISMKEGAPVAEKPVKAAKEASAETEENSEE